MSGLWESCPPGNTREHPAEALLRASAPGAGLAALPHPGPRRARLSSEERWSWLEKQRDRSGRRGDWQTAWAPLWAHGGLSCSASQAVLVGLPQHSMQPSLTTTSVWCGGCGGGLPSASTQRGGKAPVLAVLRSPSLGGCCHPRLQAKQQGEGPGRRLLLRSSISLYGGCPKHAYTF